MNHGVARGPMPPGLQGKSHCVQNCWEAVVLLGLMRQPSMEVSSFVSIDPLQSVISNTATPNEYSSATDSTPGTGPCSVRVARQTQMIVETTRPGPHCHLANPATDQLTRSEFSQNRPRESSGRPQQWRSPEQRIKDLFCASLFVGMRRRTMAQFI